MTVTANRDLPIPSSGQLRGPAELKLVVIGEDFPGETRLFAGNAGRAFGRLLEEADIPTRKSGFAHPAPDLEPALRARGAKWVILTGSDALHMVRPDLELGETHGRAFQWPDSPLICLPVFHYVSLYRRPEWRRLVIEELRDLRSMALDPDHWWKFTGDTCVKCRGEFYRIDDQGVVYCERHWPTET